MFQCASVEIERLLNDRPVLDRIASLSLGVFCLESNNHRNILRYCRQKVRFVYVLLRKISLQAGSKWIFVRCDICVCDVVFIVDNMMPRV